MLTDTFVLACLYYLENVDLVVEILLEQALIGPSPNMHLMSYLQHAVSTQVMRHICRCINK